MLMPDSCANYVRHAVGKLYQRAYSKQKSRLPTVMMHMIRPIQPAKRQLGTVVLLVADPTIPARLLVERARASLVTVSGLVVVSVMTAEAPATALERGSTAPMTEMPMLSVPTRGSPNAAGKAMTIEARVGIRTAICSSVTSVLAMRRFARDVLDTDTRLKLVAYLTVSMVSTAMAISKKSAPARLDPSDHLLV